MLLRKPHDKDQSKKILSINVSSFKCPVTHDIINATATTVNFKINKRRTLTMLQRTASPHDEKQNHSYRNIISSGDESQPQPNEEILSTSKYRKVSIILNNSKFTGNGENTNKNITNTTESFRNQSSALKRKSISDAELGSEEGVLSTPLHKRVYVIMGSIDSSDNDVNEFNGTSTNSFDNKMKIAMMRKQISTSISTPDGWKSLYSLVEELRQDKAAPVDATVACVDELAERHRGDEVYRYVNIFDYFNRNIDSDYSTLKCK